MKNNKIVQLYLNRRKDEKDCQAFVNIVKISMKYSFECVEGPIIQNFCIKDGKVGSIRFKNGIEHRFLYKEDT